MEGNGEVTNHQDRFANRSRREVVQTYMKTAPMMLRGLWWRLWLRQASGLILIGRGVRLRNPQSISVQGNFVAEDYCEIQGLSEEGVRFGHHVTVGSYAMIRPSGYYGRAIGKGLQLGSNSNVGAYCYLGCGGGITIGDNVMMSPRVSIHSENHIYERLDVPMKAQGVVRRPVIIEDDCWLASTSVILSGVHIERGAIVAAGAVVTQDVPAFAIVGGVPAQIIGWRDPGRAPQEQIG